MKDSLFTKMANKGPRYIDSDIKPESDYVYCCSGKLKRKSDEILEESKFLPKPKYNRYQWQSALNTLPVVPLNGFVSDPYTYFVLHNSAVFFNFIILTVPVFFALLFLGLGSLIDFNDLSNLLPFIKS